MKKSRQTELVIFTHGREKVKLRGDFDRETVWASQAEIAQVFGIERSVVTKHIRNILNDTEVDEKSNVQKMHAAKTIRELSGISGQSMHTMSHRSSLNTDHN